MSKAVPHHIQVQDCEKLFNPPTDWVWLEPARGPVGQGKLKLSAELWSKIRELARPRCELFDDQSVVIVEHGSRFVTALAEALPRTSDWLQEDRATLRKVMDLLYMHCGLLISRT